MIFCFTCFFWCFLRSNSPNQGIGAFDLQPFSREKEMKEKKEKRKTVKKREKGEGKECTQMGLPSSQSQSLNFGVRSPFFHTFSPLTIHLVTVCTTTTSLIATCFRGFSVTNRTPD